MRTAPSVAVARFDPDRILGWIDLAVRILGGFLVGLMTAIVLLQVVARYVLQVSIPWPEEAARYLLIWVTFLGAFLGVRRGSHFAVTFFVDLMPPGLRRATAVATNGVASAAFALLFVQGIRLVQVTLGQVTPAVQIQMGLVYTVVPLAAGLMVVHFALTTLGALVRRTAQPEPSAHQDFSAK